MSRLADNVTDEALAIAETLCGYGKFGVESTKQVLWANLDASSLEAALHLENRSQILASRAGRWRGRRGGAAKDLTQHSAGIAFHARKLEGGPRGMQFRRRFRGTDYHQLAMRSHGWSGNPPASDEEAIARILGSADRIVAERGSSMRIADVARELGVTRQTVYRYFPSTEALLVASAMQKADGFLGRLERRVRDETDPVTALVEGVAFTIETLADDEQIGFLLRQRDAHSVGGAITSDTAYTFGRSLLHRLNVRLGRPRFRRARAHRAERIPSPGGEVVPHRCRQSQARRRPTARVPVPRWIGPAIVYPQLAPTYRPAHRAL